jgi:D-Tyr-tRNAtyr deacylase/PAS domain-containing protein
VVVFLGVGRGDQESDATYLASKIAGLRIFEDDGGLMNLSLKDICAAVLAISQFTLYADCRKGRRPGFSEAALPAEPGAGERAPARGAERLEARRSQRARGLAAASAGLSVLSIGLAALLLSYAGALSLALKPWSAIALPAGLALAALMRWGPAVLIGAAIGTLAALIGSGMGAADALAGAVAVVLAAVLAQALLRWLDFDIRLERAVDVGVLAFAVVLGAALPATLAVATWFPAEDGLSAWEALSVGWAVLGLGMLGTAVAVLAFDRGVAHGLQTGVAWPGVAAAAALALVSLALLALSPQARSPVGALAMFLPHVVVVALVLRGHLAMAASFLLLAALMLAGTAARGLSFWTPGGSLQAGLAAWVGSALTLLLITHAALVHWRGRAQRWEWALDGSRLGVADWLLQHGDSFASAGWRSLSGHGSGRWTPALWLDQVHAEDRPALLEAIDALTEGRDGRRLLEVRQRQAVSDETGSNWRWLEATLLVAERDAAGRPLRLMATLADVHDKRQAQERQLMSTSLFQHLHEGLLVTDADLRVLDVNPAWLMFGDEKATPLTDEAREVAEIWMTLSEGERERVRSEIRLLASRRMSS